MQNNMLRLKSERKFVFLSFSAKAPSIGGNWMKKPKTKLKPNKIKLISTPINKTNYNSFVFITPHYMEKSF